MVGRIRTLCKNAGITVQQLERDAGIANGAIAKWTTSVPKADSLYKVSQRLNVSMEYLLTGIENPADKLSGSDVDYEIIQVLSEVSPDVRQSVLDFLKSLKLVPSKSDDSSTNP